MSTVGNRYEPMIYCTQGENANHYTTNVVSSILQIEPLPWYFPGKWNGTCRPKTLGVNKIKLSSLKIDGILASEWGAGLKNILIIKI